MLSASAPAVFFHFFRSFRFFFLFHSVLFRPPHPHLTSTPTHPRDPTRAFYAGMVRPLLLFDFFRFFLTFSISPSSIPLRPVCHHHHHLAATSTHPRGPTRAFYASVCRLLFLFNFFTFFRLFWFLLPFRYGLFTTTSPQLPRTLGAQRVPSTPAWVIFFYFLTFSLFFWLFQFLLVLFHWGPFATTTTTSPQLPYTLGAQRVPSTSAWDDLFVFFLFFLLFSFFSFSYFPLPFLSVHHHRHLAPTLIHPLRPTRAFYVGVGRLFSVFLLSDFFRVFFLVLLCFHSVPFRSQPPPPRINSQAPSAPNACLLHRRRPTSFLFFLFSVFSVFFSFSCISILFRSVRHRHYLASTPKHLRRPTRAFYVGVGRLLFFFFLFSFFSFFFSFFFRFPVFPFRSVPFTTANTLSEPSVCLLRWRNLSSDDFFSFNYSCI